MVFTSKYQKAFLWAWRKQRVYHETDGKSEIWQAGCRAVSKRDTSFSAWLRDNDELQIRMNEKVLRNLSATLQSLMLRQGCWTPPPKKKCNPYLLHMCNYIALSHAKQMALKGFLHKIGWQNKNKFCCFIKHGLHTWCFVSWHHSPHLEAVKKHRRGTKGLNSLQAAEWA